MRHEKRIAHRILVGKPHRNKALRRPRGRWVDKRQWILQERDKKAWNGTIEVWIRTSSGLLWKW